MDIKANETDDTHSYSIALKSGLTDTDESETLSAITLDNIPNGATVTGDNVTANEDGTYTVTPDDSGNATVT
jgi:hypothetical protein